MELRFFNWKKPGDPGYYLSNFSNHPIIINNITYKTLEHYYQTAKFTNPEYKKVIAEQNTPYKAKILANQKCQNRYEWQRELTSIINEYKQKGVKLRPDWEKVKDKIMYEALLVKINQNEDVKKYLLSTKDKYKILIEASPYDYYWGEGKDKTGKNKLGKMLTFIRDNIKDD